MSPDINTGRAGNNNIQSSNKQNRNGTCLAWGMAPAAGMQLKGLHCGISCLEHDGFSILVLR